MVEKMAEKKVSYSVSYSEKHLVQKMVDLLELRLVELLENDMVQK